MGITDPTAVMSAWNISNYLVAAHLRLAPAIRIPKIFHQLELVINFGLIGPRRIGFSAPTIDRQPRFTQGIDHNHDLHDATPL